MPSTITAADLSQTQTALVICFQTDFVMAS